ncbi:MAG: hypothetical protein KDI46_08640 [Alphaproteobacteria bacterium]|nr:hypothetical protein [Alphaproteobacteria bacterium]
MKHSFLVLGVIATFALPACETAKAVGDVGGEFWQRTNASESIYLQGPKAQQILNRDISRCVVELRELERLGAVKNAIPTDLAGHVLREDQLEMADWDSPERDKQLFAEHSDYTDFESCMGEKGWERVEHVPYNISRKGRENYLEAHVDYGQKARTEAEKRRKEQNDALFDSRKTGDYSKLNRLVYND